MMKRRYKIRQTALQPDAKILELHQECHIFDVCGVSPSGVKHLACNN